MKKNILLCSFFLISLLGQSQTNLGILNNTNWLERWTSFNPKDKDYKEVNKIITGVITQNTTLSSDFTYLLLGVVYVTNNAVLTIEPGVVIRGDYDTCGTLVVTKGSKIMANGTIDRPIVFTTNKASYVRRPGDWGGIVLMGDAPVNDYGGIGVLKFDLNSKYNFYGGNDVESDSGSMNYVRIEYSGRKLSSKKELNGLSCAGVGRKTVLKNIQVSFSNDDSFEFYGGDVKIENLVSYRATDDDFDFTQGVQSIFKNSIAIRNPFSSDSHGSRCFEIGSYDNVDRYDTNRKLTNIKASNITLVNLQDNMQGLVKEAIYIDTDSYFAMDDSVVYGFEFLLIKNSLLSYENQDLIRFKNLMVTHCKNVFATINKEGVIINDYELKNNNINITDVAINDFFVSTKMNNFPDFRLIEINKNREVIVVK